MIIKVPMQDAGGCSRGKVILAGFYNEVPF